MIPVFLEIDARVVALDWLGFGRSDKPVDDAAYTWDFHRDSLLRFIEALDLTDITLVVQDWSGLLGLTVPIDMADRVSGLLIMNTAFGVGQTPSQSWTDWKDYVARTPDLAVGKLIARSCTHLSEAEVAAYDAPFPDVSYKAGVRTFPALVPISPDMDGVSVSKTARSWWSEEFDGRSFMAIGANDPVLASVRPNLHKSIKGYPEPLILSKGGHFLQK